MSMLAAIYGKESFLQILFVTCVLGGGAAWIAGHTLANNWRPLAHLVFYLFLLGAGIRFTHFALFNAELFSVPAYLIDTAFLILVGAASWRIARAQRMVQQYGWLYERAGLFSWRARGN